MKLTELNSFKYFKAKYIELSNNNRFIEARDFSFDLLFTGLAFGCSIFLLNVRNSFAKGIGFAILFALMQGYIKWFAELVKEMKETKRK